ncbi:MAG TPA: SRPBCC domain-containing protein [Mycobacterium sp.]|jgi:uncharacterized protein YndB with AHSA1/START domain|nr:SRPBCC domain-containing protein [Mycobacterium sp.]
MASADHTGIDGAPADGTKRIRARGRHPLQLPRPTYASVDFSGEIACEVIDVVDGEQLAISWADAQSDKPAAWVVSWTLHPEGTGTRVILRHSGFDPDDAVQQRSRTIMGNGWVRIAGQLGEALTV